MSLLWETEEAEWVAWLILTQVDFALVCCAASILSRRPWRQYWLMAAGWFLVQALDELLFGNSIIEGRWEYPAVLVYALLVYLIVKRHVPHDTGAAEQDELVDR